MDQQLSNDVHDLLEKFKVLSKYSEESLRKDSTTLQQENIQLNQDYSLTFNTDELINIDKVEFYDDETWLHEPATRSNIQDLDSWLYFESRLPKSMDFNASQLSLVREAAHLDTKKKIDSRTFTRPKKNCTRPSINKIHDIDANIDSKDDSLYKKYNERLNNYTLLLIEDDDLNLDKNAQKSDAGNEKPLVFDLTQPIKMNVFDKISAQSNELDSFQNLSPPSLVNSMCSSLLTSIMDSSFINNDPVLRQIRDDDQESVMLQDADTTFFQSLTESCSSTNSEAAEIFVKRALGEHTLDTTQSETVVGTTDLSQSTLNNTYTLQDSPANFIQNKDSFTDVSSNNTRNSLIAEGLNSNTTYQKIINDLQLENVDPNGTILNHTVDLNHTFKKRPSSNLISAVFKVPNINGDNQYPIDAATNVQLNQSTDSLDNSDDLKPNGQLDKNSSDFVAGSSDSLDYISSLSNSSKGSNKKLNMADVDAIVHMQEQSLQVMSTPKVKSLKPDAMTQLWKNEAISPIKRPGINRSDSESSNDDYVTVRSNLSKATLGSDSNLRMSANYNSLDSLLTNNDLFQKRSNLRGIKTVTNRETDTPGRPNEPPFKGSYSNLLANKTTYNQLKGSSSNLRMMNDHKGASYGNLRRDTKPRDSYFTQRMAANKSKGSYSNVKVSPNAGASAKPADATLIITKPANVNVMAVMSSGEQVHRPQIVDVDLVMKQHQHQMKPIVTTLSNPGVRGQIRPSGLPRPAGGLGLTGIPRPMSRIPGPRAIRPVNPRPNLRPGSQTNLDGYY